MKSPTEYPTASNVPEVSRTQMLEVDRLMIEKYEISLFQMMENAGRALALVARNEYFGGDVKGARIAVLIGNGGNAGGVLTAARRLANWGAKVELGMAREFEDLTNAPRQQYAILSKIAAPSKFGPDSVPDCDLIIDGLVGYSLNGAPHGKTADFIEATRSFPVPVLSLDVPSGYDSQAGRALSPSIRAHSTLTLALPKFGMQSAKNAESIGNLFCADISVPPGLYASIGLPEEAAEIFRGGDIVRIAPV